MKSLSQHISEKLIINKNYKNVDDIKTLFDNVKFDQFKQYDIEFLETYDDIFSKIADYIRDNNIRRFSDFESCTKIVLNDHTACFAVFSKHIEDMCIFQKIPDGNYDTFSIFKIHGDECYQFQRDEANSNTLTILRNPKTWKNINDVEYYEISEATFNDISKLYDELIK